MEVQHQRRWRHNGGLRIVVWQRGGNGETRVTAIAERNGARKKKKKGGFRIWALNILYGLSSINNRGILSQPESWRDDEPKKKKGLKGDLESPP